MIHWALLVIDAQDSFKREYAHWTRRSNYDFEKNVTRLIELFRNRNQTVIFVLHNDDDVGFRPNDPECKLMEFIKPQAVEQIITKNTRSAFASTDLATRLHKLNITHLAIAGIQTEQCCETTTRDAADRGYNVAFVTEATLTFPIQYKPNMPELSTDAIIERTEYVLANRFAKIVTIDDLALGLPNAS